MITQPGMRPQILRCNDIVLPLGVGGDHVDMVEDLRRTAQQRTGEPHATPFGTWLRELLGSRRPAM